MRQPHDRLRVAYCCADPGVPVFGSKGASVHVQGVVAGLMRAGAEVELFARRRGGEQPPQLAGVRTHLLPELPRGTSAQRERAAHAGNAELRLALERAGPFELVYERYSLWSFAGMEYARASGVPGVLEVNAPLVEEQAAYRGLADRAAAERVERRVMCAATVVVAVSGAVARHVRDRAGRSDVRVIPNGIDPRRFHALPLRARGRPLTVGFVGSLKPWHGLDTLVEAFATFRRARPGARLIVVGDGPERRRLEADIAAAGVAAATRLTGGRPPAEVPRLMADMDVGVAPYPALPGFYFSPLKIVEYMAAGLPVVGSRVGEVPDLLDHGASGILCPPGDPGALAEALDRLDRPALRDELGSRGREKVLREHTWDRVTERVLELAGIPYGQAQAA